MLAAVSSLDPNRERDRSPSPWDVLVCAGTLLALHGHCGQSLSSGQETCLK